MMGMNCVSDDKMPLFLSGGAFAPEDGWRNDDTPPEGSIVDVVGQDNRGFYMIPFAVLFQNDSWFNAQTGQEIAAYVAGWRARA